MSTFQAYDDVCREKAVTAGNKRGIAAYTVESDNAALRMDDLKRRVEETRDSVSAHVQEIGLMLPAFFAWRVPDFNAALSRTYKRLQLLLFKLNYGWYLVCSSALTHA